MDRRERKFEYDGETIKEMKKKRKVGGGRGAEREVKMNED